MIDLSLKSSIVPKLFYTKIKIESNKNIFLYVEI